MALIVGTCIASPYGSGETTPPANTGPGLLGGIAAEAAGPVASDRTDVTHELVLFASERWSDPQSDFRVHLLEPSLRAERYGSRNPAGALALPGPQTSHAPAF